jgi:GTP-binding protein
MGQPEPALAGSGHGRRPSVGAFLHLLVAGGLRHGVEDTDRRRMVPGPPRPTPIAWTIVSQFVDECQLNVRGGDGGAGCVSFRREGPVVNGGPNGGDGGKGGDVWLVADHNVASLLAFRDHPHRRATNGVHGKGKDLHGRRGEDLIVAVPEGTIVSDMYTGELLAELNRHGDRYQGAAGGRGGRGNAKFLSNRRRAPTFAEQGEYGEERWLKLELKLMADVALVGFPNVGKSTLISVISAAKPKIADYPFTTLVPNLGVVRVDETTEFVVADVPGLIEGASEGRGLGHQFLRHVERARVMAVLVDLAALDGVDPAEQERILLHELGEYRPELLERPRLVVGTKADVVSNDVADAFLAAHPDDAYVVSAVTRDGLAPMVGAMAQKVHEARVALPDEDGVVLLRPEATGAIVTREEDGSFRVSGRDVERVVALNDVTTPEALNYISHRLDRLGVTKLLAKAGVRDGDVVWIAEFSFDYREE